MIEATSAASANGERQKSAVLVPGAAELQDLAVQPTLHALPRAATYLAELVRERSFLRSHVLPVLEEAEGADRWYVARRWEAPDRSFSLQVFV